MSTDPQQIYPSSSLAYLPQEQANQLLFSLYVSVFSMGVLFCDIVSNDYVVLHDFKIGLPYGVYLLSRLFTLTFTFLQGLLLVYPFPNCREAGHATHVCYCLTVSLTSLLFLFRVKAVFFGDLKVVAFFSLMWLSIPASSLASIFGSVASQLGQSRFCTVARMEPYVGAGVACLAIYDTMVFTTVSIRLFQLSHLPHEQVEGDWLAVVRGKYLPAVSRVLFRDGQIYYCVAIIFNLFELAMMMVQVPIPYHDMFAAMSFCVTNVMACRVFRRTKQAFSAHEESTLPTMSSLLFRRSERQT